MKLTVENMIMNTIKHLLRSQISALNNPQRVDMPLNKQNQSQEHSMIIGMVSFFNGIFNAKTILVRPLDRESFQLLKTLFI